MARDLPYIDMDRPRLPDRTRRRLGVALALLPLVGRAVADPASLVVLPPDFLDDHLNPDPEVVAAQRRRLTALHAQLQDELGRAGLYRIVDPALAQAAIDEALSRQANLYRCPDCIVAAGRAAHADLAMSCWVQKVSELILNVNVEVFRVASERSLLAKSVDMRGNQDASWTHAVHHLVRSMAEQRAADQTYGL